MVKLITKKFPCWIFSKVGAFVYSFFTEARLRLLKTAVSLNSFPTQRNSSGVSWPRSMTIEKKIQMEQIFQGFHFLKLALLILFWNERNPVAPQAEITRTTKASSACKKYRTAWPQTDVTLSATAAGFSQMLSPESLCRKLTQGSAEDSYEPF